MPVGFGLDSPTLFRAPNARLGGAGGADVGGMDVASVVKDIVGGGVGGAVVMAIIGAVRDAMMRR
jgi:hypothetical protein